MAKRTNTRKSRTTTSATSTRRHVSIWLDGATRRLISPKMSRQMSTIRIQGQTMNITDFKTGRTTSFQFQRTGPFSRRVVTRTLTQVYATTGTAPQTIDGYIGTVVQNLPTV